MKHSFFPKYDRAKPFLATFDPNDEPAITHAWERCNQVKCLHELNPREREIALAIGYARIGFNLRLRAKFPDGPPIDPASGEYVINICDPETFFDKIVVRLEIQAICEHSGRGVTLGRNAAQKGASPDVKFVQIS